MEITGRQAEILNRLVQEYIDSARPVSSQLLEKKYDFSICPAMIRIEMQKLTDEGFIFQPHTSAGRVPTDKGYRFFVDDLSERKSLGEGPDFECKDWIEKEMSDSIKIIQAVTKNLASISSNLALAYLPDLEILWKEGWEEIIKEPEFEEKKASIDNFVEMINSFEEEIENIDINSNTELPFMEARGKKSAKKNFSSFVESRDSGTKMKKRFTSSTVSSSTRRTEFSSPIKVYIGRENPFPKAREFSIIVSRCHFPKEENGILAIFGPKRMDYNKNIGLMNHLVRLLEEI